MSNILCASSARRADSAVRAWFICPAVGWGRRVAILYGGSIFACRRCYRLAYPSSREDAGDRATRRADRLRARLDWEPGILNGGGEKPKWMRWRTFERLAAKHDDLVGRSMQAMMLRFRLNGRRLKRQSDAANIYQHLVCRNAPANPDFHIRPRISHHTQPVNCNSFRFAESRGSGGGWKWTRDGETVASIQMRAEQDRVILIYRHRSGDAEWKDEHPVCIIRTPCRLGGSRAWFICPAVGCGRCIAILYGGGIFACRHCYRLAYASSREDAGDRATRRTDRLRARLGWEPGILNGGGREAEADALADVPAADRAA
jgi:hypothetical protein